MKMTYSVNTKHGKKAKTVLSNDCFVAHHPQCHKLYISISNKTVQITFTIPFS